MAESRIHLICGDITRIEADAIVNAANTSLLGGGGVDGAIHRAAGPAVLEECRRVRDRQGKCRTGEAVITGAGRLPARHVIHAVGPVWMDGGGRDALLASAYRNSLRLAVENQVRTIAFPNISTGIYGYPKERAAGIALDVVRQFLAEEAPQLEVTFVCFDRDNYAIYERLLNEPTAGE
jgi:O-acetyl-ADP-ribose deacetylase (regulator of RNase III)